MAERVKHEIISKRWGLSELGLSEKVSCREDGVSKTLQLRLLMWELKWANKLRGGKGKHAQDTTSNLGGCIRYSWREIMRCKSEDDD